VLFHNLLGQVGSGFAARGSECDYQSVWANLGSCKPANSPRTHGRTSAARTSRVEREAKGQSWLEVLAEGEPLAPELLAWLQSQNNRAHAVMSAPAITVSEDTELREIARGPNRRCWCRDG
jgi:hypothetical protein